MSRLLLAALLLLSPPALAQVLLVSYIDRPPYFFEQRGRAQGFLVERMRVLAAQARIPLRFERLPVRRAMVELSAARQPACLLGVFKTAARAAQFRFSLPLYTGHPFVVVSRPALAGQLAQYGSLRALLLQGSEKLGMPDGYSYGDQIDTLIAMMAQAPESAPISVSQNLHKVALGRVDYALHSGDEYAWLRRQQGLRELSLVALRFADMPPAPARHLMCAQTVPADWLARLDAAIERLGMLERIP